MHPAPVAAAEGIAGIGGPVDGLRSCRVVGPSYLAARFVVLLEAVVVRCCETLQETRL